MTALYVMVGGFLGAGKTTALIRAGEHLTRVGKRVGLIMNDQSEALVDTALVRAKNFPVEEIAGGCFCCRFNSLIEAAARLDETTRPDVFLAEPVGSCTDLNATVSLPLRHMYGDRYTVAPLSVLVDPERALRVLGVESGRAFSSKVLYVYRKQLEEADVLVINKIDTTTQARVGALRAALADVNSAARVVEMSARTGAGVADWIDSLLDGRSGGRVLDIDYDTYAEGEAELGWLNSSVHVRAERSFPLDGLLLEVVANLQRSLREAGAELGITAERARQLEERALRRLAESGELEELREAA
jgi:G3E family GTPase